MDKKQILVTGASGNTGFEIIRFLSKYKPEVHIVAAVRDIEKARRQFIDFYEIEFVCFDFEDSTTFDDALENIDTLFLLRPPQISDVKKYFSPLLKKMKDKNIKRIMFLSVQGAETSNIIPHRKIEKLILSFGFEYVFLRPSYFMQNLTTTFRDNINSKRKIILPAGKAKFNWIDISNIGEIAARILMDNGRYKNKAIEITGLENINFKDVCKLISDEIQHEIKYHNVNPFFFFKIKKEEGVPAGMILIMIVLHFLPRFKRQPKISDFYEKMTGKKPTTLKEFIKKERSMFIPDDK